MEDYDLVLHRLRPAFEDEVIEVRQRLGEGETPLVICQGAAEHEAGDFIFIEPGVPHEVFNISDTEPTSQRRAHISNIGTSPARLAMDVTPARGPR